jgi:hypothetical protein
MGLYCRHIPLGGARALSGSYHSVFTIIGLTAASTVEPRGDNGHLTDVDERRLGALDRGEELGRDRVGPQDDVESERPAAQRGLLPSAPGR